MVFRVCQPSCSSTGMPPEKQATIFAAALAVLVVIDVVAVG
jgi:hypothetical protein